MKADLIHKRRFLKKQAGFSVMEMMVTIAIISILASVAVPNLVRSMRARDFNATVQQTLALMSNAKMRAVSRNAEAAIVFDNQDIASFILDRNGNPEREIGSHQIPAGVTIATTGLDAVGGASGIVFNSRGMPDLSSGFTGGTIVINKSAQNLSRQIEINIVGNIKNIKS